MKQINKHNAIISNKQIIVDGYLWFKDCKTCLDSKETNFDTVFIIGPEVISLDLVTQAITIASYAHKVIFVVESGCEASQFLRSIGFDISETYDEYSIISSEQDLKLIKDACISLNEQRIKESLLQSIAQNEESTKSLIRFIKEEQGYFELNKDTITMGETLDIFYKKLREYIDKFVYTEKYEQETFIKHLGKMLLEKSNSLKTLEEENNSIKQKLSITEAKANRLKQELDIIMKISKFNHFVTYTVDKTVTDSKVIYVREYSYCPFVLSFLAYLRVFLTNKKISNILVVVGHNNDLTSRDEVIINDKTLETITEEQLNIEPYVKVEEPSPEIWNYILGNLNRQVVIVLDRTKAKDPVLNVKTESGISLNATGSTTDIVKYNLDRDTTITSIDQTRQVRYFIPVIEFKSRDARVTSALYFKTCNRLYIDILNRARVRNI